MEQERFDQSKPKEVERMLAKRSEKEKAIIMTAFHAHGVENISDVTEEVTPDGHCKSFIYEGKVFLIVSSHFSGGFITFDIRATKDILIALKLKKLTS
jgi:hypothetical protein